MSIPIDEQPLVSVVTPVYNGAEYVTECIESILNQTYENWEHVIVDNCSTDGTLEIARRYEARDPRIRVVSPGVFVGLVESGNRSLREISRESKYTKVIHADDWLFPECLERMVELAERNPTVGIVSAYGLWGTRVMLTGLPHDISVISGREMCRSTLLGEPYPQLFGSPSSLLIRSDLVRAHDPFYDPDYDVSEEYPFTEDTAVCFEILRESDLGFVHQVLTFIRQDERSPFSSSFARLGANLPEQVNLTSKYGPVYLTEAEYQRIIAIYLVRYGFFLLKSVPRLTRPDFRAYHGPATRRILRSVEARDVLEGIGLQLQRMRKRRRLRARRA